MKPPVLTNPPALDPRRRPLIAQEDCTGCSRCVTACPQRCLGMFWDFATLLRADDCNGCSRCESACPHGIIRMELPVS